MKIWISGEKLYLESKDSSLEEARGFGVWKNQRQRTVGAVRWLLCMVGGGGHFFKLIIFGCQ